MKNTNKFILLLAAATISGVLCAFAAMADVAPGYNQDYSKLTDVQLHDANQPKFQHGMSDLSSHEGAYRERLPMQLSAPMAKIKKAKYRPSSSTAK